MSLSQMDMSASFRAAPAPQEPVAKLTTRVVKRPHPRALVVHACDGLLPVIAELARLQMVSSTARSAAEARRMFRYPGYHDVIFIDFRGAKDGSVIAVAQDLRRLASEHAGALAVAKKTIHLGRHTTAFPDQPCVIIALCDTAEQRQKLLEVPAVPPLSGRAHRGMPLTPAFDTVLRYPLSVHSDFLASTFCSLEGPPARADAPPSHIDIVREMSRIADHRLPAELREALLRSAGGSEIASTANESHAGVRTRLLEADLASAQAAATEAELETDAANRHAQVLRDERDAAVERCAVAEKESEGLRAEVDLLTVECTRLRAEMDVLKKHVASHRQPTSPLVAATPTTAPNASFTPVKPQARRPSQQRRGSSPSRRPPSSPTRHRRTSPVNAAGEAADGQAADTAAMASDFASKIQFFVDELERTRDKLYSLTRGHHKVCAELAVSRLRFARVLQFVARLALISHEANDGNDGSASPLVSTPLFGRGRSASMDLSAQTPFASGATLQPPGRNAPPAAADPDDGANSRRSALREARLQRHAMRRLSLSNIDPGRQVSRERHQQRVASLREMVRRGEVTAMAAADSASQQRENSRLLSCAGAGASVLIERNRAGFEEGQIDEALTSLRRRSAADHAAYSASELEGLPDACQQVVQSGDHRLFVDAAFGPWLEYAWDGQRQRKRLVAALKELLLGVTALPSRFIAPNASPAEATAVTAAVHQLQDRLTFAIGQWCTQAARQQLEAAQRSLGILKTTCRGVEALLVPLIASRRFAQHQAQAETQTDIVLDLAEIDVITGDVDKEVLAMAGASDSVMRQIASALGPLRAAAAPFQAWPAPQSAAGSRAATPHL